MGLKLGIGFGLLIAVFSVLGMMALFNMRSIQDKTTHLGENYIPVTNTLYHMEHFTHEAVHAMLGYSLSEEEHYYQTAREQMARMDEYYARLDSMLSASPELSRFRLSGTHIGDELERFRQYAEQMQHVTSRITQLRHNMNETYSEFARLTHELLLKENVDFRSYILQAETPAETLVKLHQRSKRINVIIHKGDISRIETLEAVAQKNPELIRNVDQEQYIFLFSLIDAMREIADPEGLKMLHSIEESVRCYRTNMLEMAEYIEQGKRLESRLETAAFSALFEAHHISSEMNSNMAKAATDTISLLESSNKFLIIGLLLSWALAIILSVKTTRNVTVPVKKSVHFAEQVAAGNLNARVEVNQKDEIGKLADALKGMLQKLRENINKLKQAEKTRRSSILETELKERRRFAEDLHDRLGPLLSTVKLYLNSFESSRYDPEQRSRMMQQANEAINEAINSAKSIANNLRPNLLEDFGLKVALSSFFEHIKSTNAIDVNFTCEENIEDPPDRNRSSMLYNVILELTHNTIKHANAGKISVRIRQNDDICRVTYQDNGVGCDLNRLGAGYHNGLGLQNIINRIQSCNGQIELWSEPGQGFRAEIIIQ